MRFHLPALPGQPVTVENSTCAFTQKVRRFADMMVARGHDVTVYGTADFDHAGSHVACYSDAPPPPFTAEAWAPYNAAAAAAISERLDDDDLVVIAGGLPQQSLLSLPAQTFELGIGYGGSIPQHPRVFESYAWMHATYAGEVGSNTMANGGYFDAVIPASFDPSEFDFSDERGDYLLFMGRLIERKGLQIACDTAERVGCDLLIAGEGDFEPTYGQMLGRVGPDERSSLMAGARALIAPTVYLEPFGFVAVEAMLCGTPVISTDWGAFTETVTPEVGVRCRMLRDFCDAYESVAALDAASIRRYAVERYSYDAVAPLYEEFVDRVTTLRGDGWYAGHDGGPSDEGGRVEG